MIGACTAAAAVATAGNRDDDTNTNIVPGQCLISKLFIL